MKIVNEKPPNYLDISLSLSLTGFQPIFAYGDTLYNPHELDIPEDVLFHENIHCTQQGDNPTIWWTKYMLDSDFREDQEVEAFAGQLNFIKKYYPNTAVKEAEEEMASNLSSKLYNLGISREQAKTAIRIKAKDMV